MPWNTERLSTGCEEASVVMAERHLLRLFLGTCQGRERDCLACEGIHEDLHPAAKVDKAKQVLALINRC